MNDESQKGHQGVFTRIVLILGKFWPVMEKMLLPHCGNFCLVCFYFIGALYCAIFWGFRFLLNSPVIVDINVLHFSRGGFCVSFQWTGSEKSVSTEKHFTHFPWFYNLSSLKLYIDINGVWSVFCYSDKNLKQLHFLKPMCMNKMETPVFT